jgi:hypothetical protein
MLFWVVRRIIDRIVVLLISLAGVPFGNLQHIYCIHVDHTLYFYLLYIYPCVFLAIQDNFSSLSEQRMMSRRHVKALL